MDLQPVPVVAVSAAHVLLHQFAIGLLIDPPQQIVHVLVLSFLVVRVEKHVLCLSLPDQADGHVLRDDLGGLGSAVAGVVRRGLRVKFFEVARVQRGLLGFFRIGVELALVEFLVVILAVGYLLDLLDGVGFALGVAVAAAALALRLHVTFLRQVGCKRPAVALLAVQHVAAVVVERAVVSVRRVRAVDEEGVFGGVGLPALQLLEVLLAKVLQVI